MADPIEVQLGPVVRPFTATLPDGGTFTDAIVVTRSEFGDLSEAELRQVAQDRAQAHADFLADPEDAQAKQDARELVDQIESLVNVLDSEWVDLAFTPVERSGQLLQLLAQRDRALWDECVQERAQNETYGVLWTRFLEHLG